MAIRRYRYPMRHHWQTTADFGNLVPIFHQEVTPGDTWSGRSSGLVRVTPFQRPTFMQANIGVYFFFVPHRLVFPEFEEVMTGKLQPDEYTWPFTFHQFALQKAITKYFGLGQSPSTINVNGLPFYAYNMIWNEFFRDQRLDAEAQVSNFELLKVRFNASDYYSRMRDDIQQHEEETIDATGSTIGITEIRDAFLRQKFKERRSQFGERYTDMLASWGVRAPDSRLDRPELCARGSATLGISEVVATADGANGGRSLGDYAGHGIVGLNVRFPKRMFVEYGSLIGVMAVRPRQQMRQKIDNMYFTGMNLGPAQSDARR